MQLKKMIHILIGNPKWKLTPYLVRLFFLDIIKCISGNHFKYLTFVYYSKSVISMVFIIKLDDLAKAKAGQRILTKKQKRLYKV